MPVPSTIADLDPVAANNSPTGSENVGPNLDNYLRALSAFIKQISDGQAAAIEAAIKNHLPATIISIHSGSVASIPATWKLCDGTNGTIDLRDKFILGAGSGTAPVGATGGAKTVTLTSAQMPVHSHTGNTDFSGPHAHDGTTGLAGDHFHQETVTASPGGAPGIQGVAGGNGGLSNLFTANAGEHQHPFTTNTDGAHAHPFTTANAGSGGAHENMPPYYALCFIQKVWP